MTRSLMISSQITILGDELKLTFVRSSGPGGQNVNKVNSKVLLRWDVTRTTSLPDGVHQRFLERFARRISADGRVQITSQRYRDQAKNISDCLEKLRLMVVEVLVPPKQRRATRPGRSAVEKRLQQKRQTSQKKQGRGYRPSDGD